MPEIIPTSQLPEAAALTGDELVPVVQEGVTVRTTLDDVAALVNLPNGLLLPGNIIDALIDATTTHDIDPPGYNDAISVVRVSTDAGNSRTIDSWIAPAYAKFMVILNINATTGSLNILSGGGLGGAAANQYDFGPDGSIGISPGRGTFFYYDMTSQRWRRAAQL